MKYVEIVPDNESFLTALTTAAQKRPGATIVVHRADAPATLGSLYTSPIITLAHGGPQPGRFWVTLGETDQVEVAMPRAAEGWTL